jgi:hypothetical protein
MSLRAFSWARARASGDILARSVLKLWAEVTVFSSPAVSLSDGGTGLNLAGYIPFMAWEVEYTDEFESWWNALSEEEQEELTAIHLLEECGPTIPRPHADVIVQSRHSNMKELRGKIEQRQLRVLFAFDPRRTAILLIGGDKTGDPGRYDHYVPIAKHAHQALRRAVRSLRQFGKSDRGIDKVRSECA